MFPPELSLDTVANFHLTSEMTSIYTHEPVDDTKNKIQNTGKTAPIFWFLQVRRWSSWTTEDQFTAFDKKDTEWETLNVHVHYSVIRNQHSFYFHCQTVKMFFSLSFYCSLLLYICRVNEVGHRTTLTDSRSDAPAVESFLTDLCRTSHSSVEFPFPGKTDWPTASQSPVVSSFTINLNQCIRNGLKPSGFKSGALVEVWKYCSSVVYYITWHYIVSQCIV